MTIALQGCHVCGRRFDVKFSFQVQRNPSGAVQYFCTQKCQLQVREDKPARTAAPAPEQTRPTAAANTTGNVSCQCCQKTFALRYAFQQVTVNSKVEYFCSMECRQPVLRDLERRVQRSRRGPRKIAILNQKGGTGKTTTSVNLSAGLAAAGMRTLVIDMDAQGHVGVSLGAKSDHSLYHLLVEGLDFDDVVVTARENLDLIVANETLASAEIFLARMNEGRERMLKTRMEELDDRDYDFIILDCGPSLSLLNMNALTYADELIVPVSCDFLSLVGVKQILRTLRNVNRHLLHPVRILGILPTLYDRRNRISHESVSTLRGYFKEKVLPPIRINTKLKEAPSHKKTIFEYAPSSNGARDYGRLVEWLLGQVEGDRRVVA
jgi:chromosome partitioning protein